MKLPSLKRIREMRALTQTELAVKSAVSLGTIGRIERGSSAVPPTVRRIADALGVEPSELAVERV